MAAPTERDKSDIDPDPGPLSRRSSNSNSNVSLGESILVISTPSIGSVAQEPSHASSTNTISATRDCSSSGVGTSMSTRANPPRSKQGHCAFHLPGELCNCLTSSNIEKQEAILAEHRRLAGEVPRMPQRPHADLRTMAILAIIGRVEKMHL